LAAANAFRTALSLNEFPQRNAIRMKQAPTNELIVRQFGKWLFTILLLRREDWLASGAIMNEEAAYVARCCQWLYPLTSLLFLYMTLIDDRLMARLVFGSVAVVGIGGAPYIG